MPGTYDPEPEGGDPACWAHLFDEATPDLDHELENRAGVSETSAPCTGAGEMVELAALARAATVPGAIWTQQSEDLNVNLLVFASGEGVAEHVNSEVDVLMVGIAGAGVVHIDGRRHIMRAGHALVIPKGLRRGTKGLSAPFSYLTCHLHRADLWPSRRP